MWRIHQKKWIELYKLLSISEETCIIELFSNLTNFRITVIKLYLQELDISKDISIETTNKPRIETTNKSQIEREINEINKTRRNSSRYRQLLTRYQNITNIIVYIFKLSLSHSISNFQASRLKKLNELLEKEVFEIINKKDVPAETRIFDSRFVDQVKNKGTEKAFEKSRLVI